jgi:hypothetical protein
MQTSYFPVRASCSQLSGWILAGIAVFIVGLAMELNAAHGPRAFVQGQLPADSRLAPLKDLDGYFPFAPPPTRETWDARSERVRRQLLVSLGLWPMPDKTPLNAVIHGKIDQGGYTVEKVYFESVPGFFVTGSLYRPKGRQGPLPGVLCPHGHWTNGRFTDAGIEGVRREIVQGAERFEEGGRSPLQARCVQLARMGCVVFHYDMIGYADSAQIPMEIAHGFKKQRPEMNAPENWGLFSPQAEAHLQSVMGLQTWNSIRSLDFLLSLPEVDASRVAVTGASGGGTQTFVLCAIDPRPALAFPAVMVSTAMQGGCTCENASGLRVGTGNVEIAALMAPKPLGMTAANDWTKEMTAKGFPELKQLYTLMGAPDQVMLKSLVHFEHNYNYVSRAAMYSWVNRHFRLGLPEPIVEEDYHRLTRDNMTVWDSQHPAPPGGPEFERDLLRRLHVEAERQLSETLASTESFRKIVGGAADVVIGRNLTDLGDVAAQTRDRLDRGSYDEYVGLACNTSHGESLPAVLLRPKQWNRRLVIWLTAEGKAGLFNTTSGEAYEPKPEIRQLLETGAAVAGFDLLAQGEFLADGQPLIQTRRVANPREAAAYTFGYNSSLFAQRVHDILTTVKLGQTSKPSPERIYVVGLGGAGPWVAGACAQAGNAIAGAVIDTHGFRFAGVRDIQDPNFLPGGAKYFDLPGLIALHAPHPLFLAGEGAQAPAVIASAYNSAQAKDRITVVQGEAETVRQAALKWLIALISTH